MDYRKTINETDETLTSDDARVRALLSDLKRVEAPPDFDFKLKARIARTKPDSARAPRFSPALRYVLPLGLVLLISAFAVFNGIYFADEKTVAPVVENQFQTTPAAKEIAIAPSEKNAASVVPHELTSISNSPVITKQDDKQTVVNPALIAAKESVAGKRKAKVSRPENNFETEGDSRTSALAAAKTFTPPGINPNKRIETSPNSANGKSLTAKEVLSQLGIDAVFTGDAWRVKSVAGNSTAERSGVRADDAVEAIDGEKLTDKPLKRQTIEGKTLTVARGAEKIEILLTAQAN